MSKTKDRVEKDLEQRRRDCLDEKVIHLRAGDWRGLQGAEISILGTTRELHGPDGVCTCCPRRTPPGGAAA